MAVSAKMKAHRAKFKKIASMCQAKVSGGGKGRAKKVGACMKAAFKSGAGLSGMRRRRRRSR
jgi:hypothetical protein